MEDAEIKTWLLRLLSDDVVGDSDQVLRNSWFLMEAGEDHVASYALIVGLFFLPVRDVRKDTVDRYDDITFYPEWWLAFEDRIAYGALDEKEVGELRAALGTVPGLAKILDYP